MRRILKNPDKKSHCEIYVQLFFLNHFLCNFILLSELLATCLVWAETELWRLLIREIHARAASESSRLHTNLSVPLKFIDIQFEILYSGFIL